MADPVYIDASHLENVLDRFSYNFACELTARTEQMPTLRDRFAMSALQGLLARGEHVEPESLAQGAFEFADAMLRARAPKPAESETT